MARLQHGGVGFITAIVLLVLSPLSNAATCYTYLSQSDYPNCIQLDANLVLHWRVLDNSTLELAPDGDGYMSWIAIGIAEMGLKGIDYNVLIRGTEGLSWSTRDFFAIDFGVPTLDEEQNAVLQTAPDIGKPAHTLAIWQRPLDSCDDEDTPIFQDVERTVVWAYNTNSAWDRDKLSFTKYYAGMKSGVKFFTSPSLAAPPPPASAASLTVTMPSYIVPAANSTVACVNLPLPSDTGYHVISYQGFNTTPFVVRVAGYVCAAGVTPSAPAAMGVPYPCPPFQTVVSARSMLPVGCEALNYVWAPGAGAFTAPPQAGFAIGAGSATALVLQVYYQNPEGVMGKVDSSGFNLTYTSQLRNSTLGVLTVGNTDMRIPPATDRFTALPNICPASCTRTKVLAPVTLVSNFYVMGQLGVASMTRHIRNGAAVQPLGRINYWDMSRMTYQTTFPLSRTLLANDTLISLCTYNSTSVPRRLTVYGLNRTNEVCFNYITYYPVSAMPDLDYCVADTRRNISTCATRSTLARAAAMNYSDAVLLQNGTKVPVGALNISYYKSQECQLHDQMDVTPKREPNTKAAVASIVLVPVVLIIVGIILYSKYSKQEELEALLARAREEGLETALGD